jgi:CDP-6-deoxy-D-xylo-4-hexulose-3-dehydrase
MLFAGNIARQPCMEGVKCKIVGELKNTDKIMNDTFWIGIYPDITDEMISYIESKVKEFFSSRKNLKQWNSK